MDAEKLWTKYSIGEMPKQAQRLGQEDSLAFAASSFGTAVAGVGEATASTSQANFSRLRAFFKW